MSNIKLYIASIDVWPITRLGARFTYKAQNGNPGSCSFTIRDEFSNLTYDVGSRIRLEVDGQNVWAGYITSVEYSFFASVFPTRGAYAEEHGVDRALVIEGVDLNYLFQKRFIYDQNKPEEPYGPRYDADTPDKLILKKLFDEWLDLSGDNIDTSSRVEQVGTLQLFEKGRPFRTASSWGDTLRTVSRVAGSVYYIDSDRNFVYTDVDTVSSPLVLTDTPDASDVNHVGYRDMEILRDATNMVNEFHLWSQTIGVNKTMYTKAKSHDSIREHGLWQSGELTNSLYQKEYLDARARSFVYGSPQNKRGAKDPRVSVKVTVFDHVIKAGEKYLFVSNVFGYQDVIPAREVSISFPTPTNVQYDILLSHEIDDPWSFYETYWPPLEPPDLPEIDVPRVVSGPEIIRVLDSFSRTQMPTQNYNGPISNPGWGSGEKLSWQTPEHPSNAYFVSGGYGRLGSIGPFYSGVDDPTFNEVYADYPDNSSDLRNLLIKFRLGRYRRIYESEGERAYNPDGTALGIQNPEFVFDVIDEARHFPDVATSAVIPIGSPSATFSADPVVPAGGEVTHTIACGNLGIPVDPENPWYAGQSTGAGLIPAYMRLEGGSTREGVGPIEIPEPSASDLTVNSYVFVGSDVPGMTYPWDVNFWVETFGHRLTFTRTSSLTSFAGGASTQSFRMTYAAQTDAPTGQNRYLYGYPFYISSDPGTKPLPVDLGQKNLFLQANFVGNNATWIPPWDPGVEPTDITHTSRNVSLLNLVQYDQPVFSIDVYDGVTAGPTPINYPISTITQGATQGHWRWQYRSETQTWRLAFHAGPDPYYGVSPDQLLQGAPEDTYEGLPRLSFDAAQPGSGMIGPEVIVDVYLGDPFQTNIWPGVSGYREGPPADWPSLNPSELQPARPVPLYPDSTQPTGEGYAVRWVSTSGYVDSSPYSEAFLEPDTDYFLRIVQDANGSMHARIWSAGEAEPDTWYFTKKNISAPLGFGGYSEAEPTSIGPNGIRLGTTVFPFQSYTVDFDLIATATNSSGDSIPPTSVKVCEAATPKIEAGSDRVYWFVTKRPFISETVSSLSIFGIEQQKGTHYTESDPSEGLLYVPAGVLLSDLQSGGDTSVIACYYTEQLETSDGPSLGKLLIR